MKVIRSVGKDGATADHIEFNAAELEALRKAHEIVASRCAAAGVEYGKKEQECSEWCFCGALRNGGIAELMRYVTETPINRKKKNRYVGYARIEKTEGLYE